MQQKNVSGLLVLWYAPHYFNFKGKKGFGFLWVKFVNELQYFCVHRSADRNLSIEDVCAASIVFLNKNTTNSS